MPVTADPEVEVVSDEGAGEIDLSAEWDETTVEAVTPEPVHESEPAIEQLTNEADVEPAVEEISAETSDAVNETIEEIRFYLEHSMVDQARAAFVKLQSQTADYEQLAVIHAEIDAATSKAEPEAEPVESASEIAEPAPVEPEVEVAQAPEPAPETEPEPEPANPLNQMVAELDSSLGDRFLPDTATHEIVHDEQPVAHAATDPSLVGHLEFMAGPKLTPKRAPALEPEPEPERQAGVLGNFVADLEESLGDGFMQDAPAADPAAAAHAKPVPAPAAPERHMAASAVAGPSAAPKIAVPAARIAAPPVAAASAAAVASPEPATFRTSVRPVPAAGKAEQAASVDLADMFGEIRHELEEEVSTAQEDPETHYNLGVAFREMGLLDEAIGELQKVCQSVDRGDPFPQVMQTYTWLAQCFLDKGVPEAAIRWYEKALKLPNLDDETRMALHYELASSYGTAGDKASALRYFMEVYGSNIDYRDVGERIKALKS
jgi:tetratricopeptide (TPR) repeat protein